jgi:hypothetical protein
MDRSMGEVESNEKSEWGQRKSESAKFRGKSKLERNSAEWGDVKDVG